MSVHLSPTHSSVDSPLVGLLCVSRHPSQPHLVATGCADGSLCFWDLRKGRGPHSIAKAHSSVGACAVHVVITSIAASTSVCVCVCVCSVGCSVPQLLSQQPVQLLGGWVTMALGHLTGYGSLLFPLAMALWCLRERQGRCYQLPSTQPQGSELTGH